MTKTPCASLCCEDSDCPCGKECNDAGYCDVHAQEEMKRWESHFGLRPGMSRAERLLQLEAFRPAHLYPPEDV